MALKKLSRSARAPRHWALIGYSLDGKSTFAMQMTGPILVVDSDQRVANVLHRSPDPDNVYRLEDVDCTDVRAVATEIEKAIKGGTKLGSVVIDSLTAIIAPYQTEAMMENRAGENRNKSAAFMDKALAMRFIQDSITKHGLDVLWIWHMEDGRDGSGNETTRQTISATERDRLRRNLDAILTVVHDRETSRRGIEVENLRPEPGCQAKTIVWDESGQWTGMPEKIDAFLLPKKAAPTSIPTPVARPLPFRTKDEALAYAVREGFFPAPAAAEVAYNDVRTRTNPQNAQGMFTEFDKYLESLRVAKAA